MKFTNYNQNINNETQRSNVTFIGYNILGIMVTESLVLLKTVICVSPELKYQKKPPKNMQHSESALQNVHLSSVSANIEILLLYC